MQFPIFIGLHRSRFVDGLVLLVALLATVSSFAFPGQRWIQGLLIATVWILAGIAWRQLTPSITTLRLERNGQIFVTRQGGKEFFLAIPQPNSVVHPWLTVLRLKTEDGRRLVAIATVDRKNGGNFRRLRMFMRWQAAFNVPNDDA